MPCEGQLFYRGYNIYDLVGGVVKEGRYGYEEIAYLILFGELPTKEQLKRFTETLAYSRTCLLYTSTGCSAYGRYGELQL